LRPTHCAAQAQRGEWLPSVQSVAVIGAFDGEIGKQDFFVGFLAWEPVA